MRDLLLRSYLWVLVAVLGGMFAAEFILEQRYSAYDIYGEFDQSEGIFALIEEGLSESADEDWPEIIRYYEPYFHYRIRLFDLNEVELTSGVQKQLERGETVLLKNSDPPMKIYPVENDKILIFDLEHPDYGPPDLSTSYSMEDLEDFFSLLPIGLTFLAVAIAIYFIFRPLVQHIRHLSKVVEHFGQGDLTVRADATAPIPIRDLSVSFNTMAERIDQLIKERDIITGAMSHELKTPLARLRFALDLSHSSDHPETLHNYLENMDHDIEELEKLIQEMLHYNRLSHSSIRENITPLDLSKLLHSVAEELEVLTPQLKLSCHCSIENTVPGSYRDLTIAVRNIISNAQRYAKSQILIQAETENSEVVITIADDGPGIPPDQREYVLFPFARLDSSRNRKTGGSGLGLSIANQVLQGHSGQILVKESEWGGAFFELRWPS